MAKRLSIWDFGGILVASQGEFYGSPKASSTFHMHSFLLFILLLLETIYIPFNSREKPPCRNEVV